MVDNPRLLPFPIASTTGELADANQIVIDDASLTGIAASSGDVQAFVERIDATGLGAAVREFTGSFFSSTGNQDTWYGGQQSVFLRGARGQTDANRTYELPSVSEMAAAFDDMLARGLGEVYTLTVEYFGGTSTSIVRNSLTIRNASISNLFDRNEIPVTIGSGASVTFRITRSGGVVGNWERVAVSQATDPVATFGEFVFQSLSFNNRDFSFLPSSSQVLKGYAFRVINSDPDDGTLRQGLLDGGVSDRVIYDGDWVVWTADAFTSWTDGDNWFVIDAGSMARLGREATNFLAQVSEIDNRVDIGFVSGMTSNALVWLSENPLAEAPFLTPSTDPVNPRAGDTLAYVGGQENRDSDSQFQLGTNFFNSFMTVGITPNFITGHPESTIDIILRDIDGEIVQRLNLDADFTFRDDATFTNGTVRHYTRSTSFNYGFLSTIEIVATEVQQHFLLASDTVDVTQNIPERAIDAPRLSLDVQNKLNQISQRTPASLIFDTSEQKTRTVQTIDLLPGATHETDENVAFAFFDSSLAMVGSAQTPKTDPVSVPAAAAFIGFLPADTQRGTVRWGGILYDAVASVTSGGVTYFLAAIPAGTAMVDPSPSVAISIQSLEVVEQGIENREHIQGNSSAIAALNTGLASARNITDLAVRSEVDVSGYTYNPGLGYAVSSTPSQIMFGSPLSLPTRDIDANILYGQAAGAGGGVLITIGTVDLIRFEGDEVQASRFRAEVPASTRTNQQYVSTLNGAGLGAGDPIVMNAGFRTADGDYQPEDSAISVTQNLPTANEAVNIAIDGIINGNDGGVVNITLPFGQTAFESVNYVTTTGFNTTITFRARYRNNNNEIELELINPSSNLAVDGAHFNVLVTYDETVVMPSVPAGRDWVRLGNTLNGSAIFAVGLFVTGGTVNVFYNVNGASGVFDTLTAEPTGIAVANSMMTVAMMGWLQDITFDDTDEQTNINIFDQLVSNAVTNINDGYLGSRTATTSHEVIVGFTARVSGQNVAGDNVNLGEELILVAPNGTRWRTTITNAGVIETVQVT